MSQAHGTVLGRASGRRVVRRARPALDVAYERALPDLPADLRLALQLRVEAHRGEQATRSALSGVMARHSYRWFEVERLARQLG